MDVATAFPTVETTYLSVTGVADRNKNIQYTFSCNNMQIAITRPSCPDDSLDNVDVLKVV